ncbi:DUF4129 domain-containing protein [Aeoliella sp. ICT_H6.2]|uniref:DUF4129 domain-containing protein n=1 Tax=Aeoliella straminimaris TaxID=2954799 RepID=A0A9X2FD51_9BACT|nr:DUF4129 domain-containing protein [Aeoliella straminimaris]MCO6046877.1 DUF4129 domain-containing protein [Aeoliella straminimaris]
MAKRLFMTSADYLAIAVSPALIMLLVGSLVFFLLEVLYVGEYQARLNYVFALFVFATVLVARISIEMGSERAAMYSVPLALATFVVLQKFVEHPSVFSPLINIVLIAVVWWCAHKLTWDCTVIDDSQDASGEGLMQLVGVDDAEVPQQGGARQANQLLPDGEPPSFWQQLFSMETGPHAPGLWVLYFSLAALPIFGIGQGFIPSSDTAGRRYAFLLLFVYVASGLLLLVTTSFLGFRRYLRQRGVDMPNPMAATWVGVGGVLTAIVLVIAMLLPRPNAEFAVAQPPWQASSPDGLSSSRYGRGSDGAEDNQQSSQAVTKEDEDAPTGNQTSPDAENRPPGEASKDGKQTSDSGAQGEQSQSSGSNQQSSDTGGDSSADASQGEQQNQSGDEVGSSASDRESAQQGGERNSSDSTSAEREEGTGNDAQSQSGEPNEQQSVQPPEHSGGSKTNVVQALQSVVGGITGLIKWLFYLVLALVFVYLLWKYRHELLAAARDIWRDLKALLARLMGREVADTPPSESEASSPLQPRRRFRDFQNPFMTGAYQKVPAAELVRYTFDALEAWSADRGRPRRTDQTPLEFVEAVSDDTSEMYQPMRNLCHLYGRVAYGGGRVTTKDQEVLREIWQQMEGSSALSVR